MHKLIIALIALCVLVAGFFILNTYIYQEKQVEETVSETSDRDIYLGQFTNQSIEIAFDYPDGPDGYVVDEVSAAVGEQSERIEVVEAYRIINSKEKVELENSDTAREAPPTMQLTVFNNDQNQSASMWVDAFPNFSNIEMLLGEVDRDAVVGGANAVRYTTDGLYVTDNVVVASGNYVYHFAVGYLEADSVIHQDFKALVDSVRFTSPTGTEGRANARIDVQVVCENALAYMSFETGAAADKFVAECVAGEHPDVIERYINDLGLDPEII